MPESTNGMRRCRVLWDIFRYNRWINLTRKTTDRPSASVRRWRFLSLITLKPFRAWQTAKLFSLAELISLSWEVIVNVTRLVVLDVHVFHSEHWTVPCCSTMSFERERASCARQRSGSLLWLMRLLRFCRSEKNLAARLFNSCLTQADYQREFFLLSIRCDDDARRCLE